MAANARKLALPASTGAEPYLLQALEALTNLVELKGKIDKLESERTSAQSYRVAPSLECLRELEACYRKEGAAWKKAKTAVRLAKASLASR